MEYLPYDMYMEITKYISIKDLFHMLMVSSNINKILKDNITDIIYINIIILIYCIRS